MGRPKLWNTAIALKLGQEMLDQIAAALTEGEDRAAFIRTAITKELARRAKTKR